MPKNEDKPSKLDALTSRIESDLVQILARKAMLEEEVAACDDRIIELRSGKGAIMRALAAIDADNAEETDGND